LVSLTTIHNAIKGFHFSLKILTVQTEAANTPELLVARREYSLAFSADVYENRNFIFVDEVGFKMSQRIRYGRALIGDLARIETPAIRTRNISVMAAMNRNGYVA
jgi:hypothetical protein